MHKRVLWHILFWIVVLAFFTTYFGFREDEYGQSFFFVALLLPITMATTYAVVYWLIPRYLLPRRFALFGLYFTYILIASIYFEFLLLVGLYITVSEYKEMFISASFIDQVEILVGMYIVVLSASTLYLVRRWGDILSAKVFLEKTVKQTERELAQIKSAREASISVRSDRKTVRIPVVDILYVESMRDYVRIITRQEKIITKMTLKELDALLQPFGFTRIHRSFLVNDAVVTAFSGELVEVPGAALPIGRSYRKDVMDALGSQ